MCFVTGVSEKSGLFSRSFFAPVNHRVYIFDRLCTALDVWNAKRTVGPFESKPKRCANVQVNLRVH